MDLPSSSRRCRSIDFAARRAHRSSAGCDQVSPLHLGRLKGRAAGAIPAHDPNFQRIRDLLQPGRIEIHNRAVVVFVQ
jgi:hypothetical protein